MQTNLMSQLIPAGVDDEEVISILTAYFGSAEATPDGYVNYPAKIRDARLITLWQTRDYLGLSARINERRLTLEYRDPDLFYERALPDAYKDVYVQTKTGVKRISHTPLPEDRQ